MFYLKSTKATKTIQNPSTLVALVATDPLVTRLQSFGKEHFGCPSSYGFRRVQQETLRLVVCLRVFHGNDDDMNVYI